MSFLDSLPTLAEMNARPRPVPKGKSRLQAGEAEKKLSVVDERKFKAEVWDRDKGLCRCCGRKVVRTMSRVPNRGEVNHIHGRIGDLRFEARAAVLLCLRCHERVTGKVNDRLVIVATKTFTILRDVFTDARFPVKFQKVA